ncbi:MAG: hypothetical protein KDC98_00110 [Planctomycetes bacterium]|nr:hypothetical protein [Planctomycetota bacterium]
MPPQTLPVAGTPQGMRRQRAVAWLVAWLLIAVAFSAVGGLRWLPPPFPQLVLAALVALQLVLLRWSPSVRTFADRVPVAAILGLHLGRFVGGYFLWLYDRGELPFDFAVLGGIGDIVVAAGALALLAVHRGSPPVHSRSLQIWNAIGLVDIVFVVVAAARNALAASETMAPLLRLPLALLPTWLVPLIIASHLLLILRGLGQLGRRPAST